MRPLCRFYASDFITKKYPMKLYNVPVKHKSSTLRNFCDCQLFSAYAFNFRGREILDLWIMSGWYMYNWESIKEVISKIARSQKVDDNIPALLRMSREAQSSNPQPSWECVEWETRSIVTIVCVWIGPYSCAVLELCSCADRSGDSGSRAGSGRLCRAGRARSVRREPRGRQHPSLGTKSQCAAWPGSCLDISRRRLWFRRRG